jgi:putative membrane protein
MIKLFILSSAIHILAIFLLTQILPGVEVNGGLVTLLIAGFSLTLLDLVVKPILNVISFPINLVTLGLFSIVTNAIILYLLTVFVPNVIIKSFTFPGGTYGGVTLSKMEFSTLMTFAVASVTLSLIVTVINWLIE